MSSQAEAQAHKKRALEAQWRFGKMKLGTLVKQLDQFLDILALVGSTRVNTLNREGIARIHRWTEYLQQLVSKLDNVKQVQVLNQRLAMITRARHLQPPLDVSFLAAAAHHSLATVILNPCCKHAVREGMLRANLAIGTQQRLFLVRKEQQEPNRNLHDGVDDDIQDVGDDEMESDDKDALYGDDLHMWQLVRESTRSHVSLGKDLGIALQRRAATRCLLSWQENLVREAYRVESSTRASGTPHTLCVDWKQHFRSECIAQRCMGMTMHREAMYRVQVKHKSCEAVASDLASTAGRHETLMHSVASMMAFVEWGCSEGETVHTRVMDKLLESDQSELARSRLLSLHPWLAAHLAHIHMAYFVSYMQNLINRMQVQVLDVLHVWTHALGTAEEEASQSAETALPGLVTSWGQMLDELVDVYIRVANLVHLHTVCKPLRSCLTTATGMGLCTRLDIPTRTHAALLLSEIPTQCGQLAEALLDAACVDMLASMQADARVLPLVDLAAEILQWFACFT